MANGIYVSGYSIDPVEGIPDGYSQVAAIEFDGTQSGFNTGFTPTNNTKIVATVELLENTGTKNLALWDSYDNGIQFGFWVRGTQIIYHYGLKQIRYDESWNPQGKILIITQNKNYLLINNKTIGFNNTSQTFTSSNPLYIGNSLIDPDIDFKPQMRIYEFTIYENDILAAHYIPIKSNDSSYVGFYDTVGKGLKVDTIGVKALENKTAREVRNAFINPTIKLPVKKLTNLPEGITQVNNVMIEEQAYSSDVKRHFNLGKAFDGATAIDIYFCPKDTTGAIKKILSMNNSSKSPYIYVYRNTETYQFEISPQCGYVTFPYDSSTRIKITMDESAFKINGDKVYKNTSDENIFSQNSSYDVLIGDTGSDDAHPLIFYYIEIRNGNIPIHQYYPITNGTKYGFYDSVTKELFYHTSQNCTTDPEEVDINNFTQVSNNSRQIKKIYYGAGSNKDTFNTSFTKDNLESGYITYRTGELGTSVNFYHSSEFYPIVAGNAAYLQMSTNNLSTDSGFIWYDKNKTLLGNSGETANPITDGSTNYMAAVSPNNTAYFKFNVNKTNITTQTEANGTLKTYSPAALIWDKDEFYTSGGETVTLTTSNIADYFDVSNSTYYFAGSDGTWTSNNKGVKSSTAQTILTAKADYSSIAFSYSYSSETSDKYTVIVADTTILSAVGGSTTTKTYSGSIKSGETITFKYVKDSTINSYNDVCTFSAFTLTTPVITTKRYEDIPIPDDLYESITTYEYYSGTYTIDIPENATTAIISACGGGGGGGAGYTSSGYHAGGSGGGGGAAISNQNYDVSSLAGTSISVTVGSGGSGTSLTSSGSIYTNATTGGTTSIPALSISLPGGGAGANSSTIGGTAGGSGGGAGGGGGSNSNGPNPGSNGQSGIAAGGTGGITGDVLEYYASGGGGGGGSLGKGGNGGYAPNGNAYSPAAAQSGTKGGGGGGGFTYKAGANGGSGYVNIQIISDLTPTKGRFRLSTYTPSAASSTMTIPSPGYTPKKVFMMSTNPATNICAYSPSTGLCYDNYGYYYPESATFTATTTINSDNSITFTNTSSGSTKNFKFANTYVYIILEAGYTNWGKIHFGSVTVPSESNTITVSDLSFQPDNVMGFISYDTNGSGTQGYISYPNNKIIYSTVNEYTGYMTATTNVSATYTSNGFSIPCYNSSNKWNSSTATKTFYYVAWHSDDANWA